MKRFLKNKLVLLISILLIILLMMILIINKLYLLLLLMIIIGLLSVALLYKKIFNISFFNLDRIKKCISYRYFKKNVQTDEIYSSKMMVDVFDSSNEFTHPSVLCFKEKFNGYKFWMAYTPYRNCLVELENPCIGVSNDGINFKTPNNLKNPLLPIIKNNNKDYKEYYNDPNLIYVNNKLELWYRLTKEYVNKKFEHKIYRIISVDGVNWSEPQLIIEDNKNYHNYISISLFYMNEKYYLYYFNLDLKPTLIVSKDLKKWSNPVNIISNNYNGSYWHGEIKEIDNSLKYLFVDNSYNLYLGDIENDIYLKNVKKINIICNSNEYFYFKNVLYKSSIVCDDRYMYLYVPYRYDKVRFFRVNNVIYHKWVTTITKVKKENIYKYLNENCIKKRGN